MGSKIFHPPEWCIAPQANVPNASLGCVRLYRRDDGSWVERDDAGVDTVISGADNPNSLYNNLNESYELLFTETDCIRTGILAHEVGNPAVKIREWDQFTYDANCMVTGMRVRQFADDGTTVLETMTLTGGNVWTRT